MFAEAAQTCRFSKSSVKAFLYTVSSVFISVMQKGRPESWAAFLRSYTYAVPQFAETFPNKTVLHAACKNALLLSSPSIFSLPFTCKTQILTFVF